MEGSGFIYLVFLLLVGYVSAQTQRVITLHGEVLNDTIERANLSVVNVSMKLGAITSTEGKFEIEARLKDTIHLSAVQYESYQFVVSEKMMSSRITSFYLVPKVTELTEVQLSNSVLTGSLKADMLPFDTDKIYDSKRVNLPQNIAPERTPEERRLYTSSTRGPDQVGRHNARFDIPLLAVINGISGKARRLKKHVAVSNFQLEVNRQRSRFSDSTYIKTMHIPLELIDDFVFYSMSDTKEIAKIKMSSAIELFAFFEKKAKTYLVLKAQEREVESTESPLIKQ